VRCPKCHYLSFEPEPRCKNCGYDLAFGSGELPFGAQPEENRIQDGDTDFDLISRPPKKPPITGTVDLGPVPPVGSSGLDLPIRADEAPAFAAVPEPSMSEPEPAPRRAAQNSDTPAVMPRAVTTELPLFVRAAPEGSAKVEPPDTQEFEDLVTKLRRGARAPLSVRRTTPSSSKLREQYGRRPQAERQVGLLDREILEPAHDEVDRDDPPIETIAPVTIPARVGVSVFDESATATRRLEAALVDSVVLGGIDVGIIWLTLRMCGLTFSQMSVLPILPLAAFLFLLNCGYLLMFTAASGQTIGKMAAGIRVVAAPDELATRTGRTPDLDPRLTFGQAVVRSVTTFVAILTFGAAFVPALLGSRRALHDRFAHTRVVRA
jgi:uncharacterized RDD family membrane protein YckC